MKHHDLDIRMKERESFRTLRLLPGAWTVVRVDGRAFSQFTAPRFAKPFDAHLRDRMIATASALLQELHGIYTYTQSDEISVLFPPQWQLFDRRLEKIVSISASLASATFTQAGGEPVQFDSRVWLGTTEQDVIDYFRWRQLDATRCALHGWCYWTLRQQGDSAPQAAQRLNGKGAAFMNELLFQAGINFNDLPAWQRRGIGLYWETYPKAGFNPHRQEAVTTTRRRLKVKLDLPMPVAYADFLRQRWSASAVPAAQ